MASVTPSATNSGPITAPYKASVAEEQMRELFFFDMLAAGIYLARRGMVALMLPVTDADGRLVGTVGLRELSAPGEAIGPLISRAATASATSGPPPPDAATSP